MVRAACFGVTRTLPSGCHIVSYAYFSATRIPFKKMYGLGNDFIVLDARKDASVRAALLAKSRA
jgi:hypothetical protein